MSIVEIIFYEFNIRSLKKQKQRVEGSGRDRKMCASAMRAEIKGRQNNERQEKNTQGRAERKQHMSESQLREDERGENKKKGRKKMVRKAIIRGII